MKTRKNEFECVECHRDTSSRRGGLDEYYCVRPCIWRRARMTPAGGMLCIGCLEGRIGRTLIPADFWPCPLNIEATRSERLRRRREIRCDEDKIRMVFAQLRARGFFAAARHTCCASCGWYEVPKSKKTAVFYHQQAGESAFDRRGKLVGELNLQHRGDAAEICYVFRSYRVFHVEWSGDAATCITVTLKK